MQEAVDDWNKFLKKTHDEQTLARVGNKVVKYASLEEMNKVITKNNLCFNDVLENPQLMLRYASVKRQYDICKSPTHEQKLRYAFDLYCKSPHPFKPSSASYFLKKYKSRVAVLDPTMGWGGRLVGATAVGVPKYIGIDSNVNLKPCYDKILSVIQPNNILLDLRFQDALSVDYSQLEYDVVMTSPPYFNIEIYPHMKKRTKQEWIREFYNPLFESIWMNLKHGGYLLLNINDEMYEKAFKPLLGECSEKEIILRQTPANSKKKEYMYVWIK